MIEKRSGAFSKRYRRRRRWRLRLQERGGGSSIYWKNWVISQFCPIQNKRRPSRPPASRTIASTRSDLLFYCEAIYCQPCGFHLPRFARPENFYGIVSSSYGRTAIKNQLLALLARRNIRPQVSSRWTTVGGRNEIQALELGLHPGVI